MADDDGWGWVVVVVGSSSASPAAGARILGNKKVIFTAPGAVCGKLLCLLSSLAGCRPGAPSRNMCVCVCSEAEQFRDPSRVFSDSFLVDFVVSMFKDSKDFRL